MGAMSRRKGASGERELVNIAKAKGLHARRMAPMQAQYDSHETDVEIEGIYKVEVKRCQQLQLMKWMLQHEAAVEDGHPILAFRRNGDKWRALVNLDLLLDLILNSAALGKVEDDASGSEEGLIRYLVDKLNTLDTTWDYTYVVEPDGSCGVECFLKGGVDGNASST